MVHLRERVEVCDVNATRRAADDDDAMLANAPAVRSVGNGSIGSACMVSAFSSAGLGHVLESCLQCIGVAAELGMQYIHTPFINMEHGTNATAIERFLAFNEVFPVLAPHHKSVQRWPINYHFRGQLHAFDQCGRNEDWFDQVALGTRSCPHDGTTVTVSDNCGGRFYCTTVRNAPQAWYGALHPIRRQYKKGVLEWPWPFERDAITVVVHVRLGEPKRALPLTYHRTVMLGIRARHNESGIGVPLRFRVHADVPNRVLAPMLRSNDFGDVELFGRVAPRWPGNSRIHKNAVDTLTTDTLNALYELIESDVLVGSRSSLSYGAGLIGNQTFIIPSCFDRHPLPHWSVAPCSENRTVLQMELSKTPWPPLQYRHRHRHRGYHGGPAGLRQPNDALLWPFL